MLLRDDKITVGEALQRGFVDGGIDDAVATAAVSTP